MARTNYGAALKAYIEDELLTLDNVDECTSWEDTLGRRHAKKSLKKLLTLTAGEPDKVQVTNQYT